MVLLPVYNETNIYSSHIFDQRWETKNCITKHVFIFANISHIHVVKCSLQGTNTTNRITDVQRIHWTWSLDIQWLDINYINPKFIS